MNKCCISIRIQGEQKKIWVKKGANLYQSLVETGFVFNSYCGGKGTCGKCKVKILSDQPSIVLACRVQVDRDVSIEIPTPTNIQDILVEGFAIQLDTSDSNDGYGVAIDIGTTTIAMYLLDLNSGDEIGAVAYANPQLQFGADVISRINYTLEHPNGIVVLQKVLIKVLNDGVTKLVKAAGLTTEDLNSVAIVGNTVMLHTLMGVSAESIANAPFTPIFVDELVLSPSDLDLNINQQSRVFVLPSVSGYIGADILADLLATEFINSEKPNLLIDIGTNGEIVLGSKDELLACSAAAGPAFEGAKITCGTASINGAISHIKLTLDGKIRYTTIGNRSPVGICGSGLIDLIAELVQQGIVLESGAFALEQEIPSLYRERLVMHQGMRAFVIEEGILLTQKDIREFQLAKGAIAAGIQVLLKESKIDLTEIKHLYLAGGFGTYLDPIQASKVGLFPAPLTAKAVKLGNAAGSGAKLYLLSKKHQKYLQKFRSKIKYIELSGHPDFQEEFINGMTIGGWK
ncbi:MAG: DUF4445 domain-containing protein [Firmicutes bacterium]|nr:DUF4445 domain-containing protein [Bacillota bacterium]